MAKKPTIDDARLILELYDLRREAEMRKARQWWLNTFWPMSADDFITVATAMGTEENNWLRQVGAYWGIAVSFVLNGVLSEKLFFQVPFWGTVLHFCEGAAVPAGDSREDEKSGSVFDDRGSYLWIKAGASAI
jgi:hypothetical protein